jgi:hypothetical protein
MIWNSAKNSVSRRTISSSAKSRGCSSSRATMICSLRAQLSSCEIQKSSSCSSATANGAGVLKIWPDRSAPKTFCLHRPRAASRSSALFVGIMDALAHLSLREGCQAHCRRRSPPASPSSLTIATGRAKFVSTAKPGSLIPPGDLKKFDRKNNPARQDDVLRQKLGQSGTDFVRENFAVEKMVDSIYDLYLKLAAERGLRL